MFLHLHNITTRCATSSTVLKFHCDLLLQMYHRQSTYGFKIALDLLLMNARNIKSTEFDVTSVMVMVMSVSCTRWLVFASLSYTSNFLRGRLCNRKVANCRSSSCCSLSESAERNIYGRERKEGGLTSGARSMKRAKGL